MNLVQQCTSPSNVKPGPAILAASDVGPNTEELLESKLQSDRLFMLQLQQSKLAIEETIRSLEKRMALLQTLIQDNLPKKEEPSPDVKIQTPVVPDTLAVSVKSEDHNVKENNYKNDSLFTNENLSIVPLPQRKPKNIVNNLLQTGPSTKNIAVEEQVQPVQVHCANVNTQPTPLSSVSTIRVVNSQGIDKNRTQAKPFANTAITSQVSSSISTVKTVQAQPFPVPPNSLGQMNVQGETSSDKAVAPKSIEIAKTKPLPLNSIVSNALASAISTPESLEFSSTTVLSRAQSAAISPQTEVNIHKSTHRVNNVTQKNSPVKPAITTTASTSTNATISVKSFTAPISSVVTTTTQSTSKKSKGKKSSPKTIEVIKDTANSSHRTPTATAYGRSASTLSTVSLQTKPVPVKSSNVGKQSNLISPKPLSNTPLKPNQPEVNILKSGDGWDTVPITKIYCPPIIVEILSNRLQHACIQYFKNRFGKEFKVRTFGKTVRFQPETAHQNRVVKDYLNKLEKTENITWFVSSV